MALGRTGQFDEASRAALHSLASPGLTRSMQVVTLFGSQLILLSVTACAGAFLLELGRRDAALRIAAAVAGAEFLMWILKAVFHRPRPEPFFSGLALETYSFPSGHALLSLCCYGMLVTLAGAGLPRAVRWLARIAAALLILAIGISRVYLGAHYSSDVIAGFLVAVVWMTALVPRRQA